MMALSFTSAVTMSKDVLLSQVEGESVLLNLQSERYFGLDEVGTRILSVLTSSSSVQAAYEALLDEYDVDAAALRQDLIGLIDKLRAQGLVNVAAK